MEKVLHYIYDPLCGWCYAAERLVDAAFARAQGRFEVRMHAGGLFANTRLSDTQRRHIRSADARIGELTGQVFGEAYLNGLLNDPGTVYDSAVPIRGILAADRARPGAGPAMLKALQRAHYRDGLRIVEAETVIDVAGRAGLDTMQFVARFERVTDADVQAHMHAARRLMQGTGARGYPTFVAQIGHELTLLPHEPYYRDPEGFAELVGRMLVP